jgi:2-methylisocitrate lyase-like PEP mutase family enzyme
MGFKIALYPGSGFLAAAQALKHCYGRLKSAGIATGGEAPLLAFSEMNQLMGFPAVHAFEQRYGLADRHKE